MANGNDTFGTENPAKAGPGIEIRDLVRFTVGAETNDIATSRVKDAFRGMGYREKDVRRMGRAWDKVRGNPNREYILHGDDTFSVKQDGQLIEGSGRGKGNVEGFDLGDIVRLGKDISMLAGGVQSQMTPLVEQQFKDRAGEEKLLAADISEEMGKELEGLELDIDPNIAGPAMKVPSKEQKVGPAAPVTQELPEVQDAFDIEKDFITPGFDPEGGIESTGIRKPITEKPVEASKVPSFWREFLTGNASDIENAPFISGISEMFSPSEYNEMVTTGLPFTSRKAAQFTQGFSRQAEANKLRLGKLRDEAMAAGERGFEFQGTGFALDEEGNIAGMTEGISSPFNLGLFTPGAGLVGKGIDKLNQPGRFIKTKFKDVGKKVTDKVASFFKSGPTAPKTMDGYFQGIQKINKSALGPEGKELALRELTKQFDDVIKASRTKVPSAKIPKAKAPGAPQGPNTLQSNLSSNLSQAQVNAEIKAFGVGRKSGTLSDGTRLRLGNKSKLWEIFRQGGKVKTKFSY